MGKRLLIDLVKLRDLGDTKIEAIDKQAIVNGSFKTIRELATFQFTCRRCSFAPCIDICPAEALERDDHGIINRAINLCVRCKSCVAMCPFGTIMNDLFEPKIHGYNYFDINDDIQLEAFADAFPAEVVCVTEDDPSKKDDVFAFNEKILIRDHAWRGVK